MSNRVQIIGPITLLLGMNLLHSEESPSSSNGPLLDALQKLDDAFVTGDEKTIRRCCAPNHMSLTARYQFFELNAQLKTLGRLKLTSNKAGPKTVAWVTADVALVRYEAKLVGTYAGKTIDSTVQVLTTWVRRDGQWIQISYQETPLNQ